MFHNCKNAILSPFGRNVSVVNVILMEHSQRRRGETPLWTKSLKLYLAGSFKNYIRCTICPPTCGPSLLPTFAGGTSCVLCFLCVSALSSISVVEDICILDAACVFAGVRVYVFVFVFM